jgi:hypothetical protein
MKDITGRSEELFHSFSSFVLVFFDRLGRVCLIELGTDAEIGPRGILVVRYLFSEERRIIVMPKFCETPMSYYYHQAFVLPTAQIL